MLTVLMTARDEEKGLPEVLSAYARLEPPTGGWKVVATDDGSRDATRAVLESWRDRLPLEVRAGPPRGLNRARNAALDAVEGDLLVVTDADAVPVPGWLAHLRAAADAHPEAVVFAGAVRARFVTPPSKTLRHAVRKGPSWAVLDGEVDRDLAPTEALGPNFAIRVAALPPAPVFDEDIGPDGSPWFPMGAETGLFRRLEAAGARGRFVSAAKVDHVLPAEATTVPWLLRRAIRHGRGRHRLGLVSSAHRRLGWGGIPLGLRIDLVNRRRGVARAIRRGDEEARIHAHWRLCYLAGQALGSVSRRGPVDPEAFLSRILPASTRERLGPTGGTRATADLRIAVPS